MSGINVSEGIAALNALGIRTNIKTGNQPRSEAVLKGIIMNPAAKDTTRANALLELKALKEAEAAAAAPVVTAS